MRVITVSRAATCNGRPDEARIDIIGAPPEFLTTGAMDEAEVNAWYEAEARKIERLLYATLPGGTYDKLVGLMLLRKASHFRVSHEP